MKQTDEERGEETVRKAPVRTAPKGQAVLNRRAAALRENLRKRKSQAKARKKQEPDPCP